MARGIMRPGDLVVSVLANNPILQNSVLNGWLSERYLKARMLNTHSKVLSYGGIRPHYVHADSQVLDESITDLVGLGLLLRTTGSDALRWDCEKTPQEYYEMNIAPYLTPNAKGKLKVFARRVN